MEIAPPFFDCPGEAEDMTPPATDPDREKAPDEVYCRDCGSIIRERAEICPECGVRQQPASQASDVLDGGNPVLAALLSAILPGLGQIYNRELERGLAFIAGSIVSGFLAIFVIGLLIYPLVWVFAIYDAYTRAEQAFEERTGAPVDEPPRDDATRPHDAGDRETPADEWGSGSRTDSDDQTGSNDSYRR